MTLTYTLQIWNEDADLPSGESSACDDDSAVDSFASALTTLDSACESAECASYHTAPVSSTQKAGNRHGHAVNYGPDNDCTTIVTRKPSIPFNGLSKMGPAPVSVEATTFAAVPSLERNALKLPSVELNALKLPSRSPGSEEEDSDGSLALVDEEEDEISPPIDDELPPPDEVVGNDTSEWHDDYSDNSNQAESVGFLDDSSDSQYGLSTMWDVPSFDQDSEWEGDPEADSGWDSLPPGQRTPLLSSTGPSKHNVPPQVMNMFKKPSSSTCDSTWHSHVDIALSLRRHSPLSGQMVDDLSLHGNSFRPWPSSALMVRSPFSTLDTIQESNSRSCSPLLAAAALGLRPRSRSHSSRRQGPGDACKPRVFRSRSGSATGRLECSAYSFNASLANSHEAWSHAAWTLDEDTRRVLARFQGFRPFNQMQQEQEQERETNGAEDTSEGRAGTEDQVKIPWPSGKGGPPDDKNSRFGEQSVLVDESLLSSKDRARYRRHLRRLRLRSSRYLEYPSDSEDPSDTEEGSALSSNLQSGTLSDPLMSSD